MSRLGPTDKRSNLSGLGSQVLAGFQEETRINDNKGMFSG
jgi:hypothetical protein